MSARVLSSSRCASSAARGAAFLAKPSSSSSSLLLRHQTRRGAPPSTIAPPSASNDANNNETTSAANVVAANPLFANNPAFASVLADSLSRQGSEALVSGEARSVEDEFDKEGPIEEVLASCLRDQRQAVVQLENLEKVVKQALEREKKQFERLQFAFKKAGNDRAYAQSLAKLRKRDKEEKAALEEEIKRLRG